MKSNLWIPALCLSALVVSCKPAVTAACQSDDDCRDDSACTQDICGSNGKCSHPATVVDDANACTLDSCDPATGVQHQTVAVDDGNVCTADSCDPATGVAHNPVNVDDGNACTTDRCTLQRGITHTPVSVDDQNTCTTDACDPATGQISHDAVAADDQDACTIDSCDSVLGVLHRPVETNDGNACTVDSCDPTTGVHHAAVATSDNNACTADACDPSSGQVTHVAVNVNDSDACTADACDPTTGQVSHVAVNTSDNDACTTDSCNPTTGAISHVAVNVNDSDACTADACNPTTGQVTHVAVNTSDGDACTTDSCNPSTGAISHAAVNVNDSNVCTDDACNPSTGAISHVAVNTNDNNACTADACDPVTGVSHNPVNLNDNDLCTTDACDPATGVSHVAVNTDDGNACTADACSPATGVSHNPVNVNDNDACTTDSCNPSTGAISHVAVNVNDNNQCTNDLCNPSTGVISHPPVSVDDGIACTDDACSPSTGIAHTPVNSRCETDGYSCTVALCSATTGCSETATPSVCNDNVGCTTDACVGVGGKPSTGCANTQVDAACNTGEICLATGCVPTDPGAQVGNILITEFSAIGAEFVELYNNTGNPIDVRGFVIKNSAGVQASIRAASDRSGAANTPVVIPAGGYAYGSPNPVSGAVLAGTAFVYGGVGTTFNVSDSGDILSLYSTNGTTLQDTVDFHNLAWDWNAPLGTAFVASALRTTQLDGSLLGAMTLAPTANDTYSAWCISFRPASGNLTRIRNTLGAANGNCNAVVINEVMIHNAFSGDDGRTFVELAGPGGTDVGGWKILDIGADGQLDVDGDVGAGETDGVVELPAGTRIPVDGLLIIADGVNSGPNGFIGSTLDNIVTGVDVTVRDMDIHDGAGAVQLLDAGGGLRDVLGYHPTGGAITSPAFNGLPTFEGATATLPALPADALLARSLLSADSQNNSADWSTLAKATQGNLNRQPGATISPHLALGVPDDSYTSLASSNAYLAIKPQFVTSYNSGRRIPGWTSWEVNQNWNGPITRQDTFRPDDTLPGSMLQAQLSDYSGSGYDRGHMCPSADRKTTIPDNSATFYLSNMVPQAANNNQGPWEELESVTRDEIVYPGGKSAIVLSGGIFGGPYKTVGANGVTVPSFTWKVITLLSAPGQGPGSVTNATRVIGVIMANDNALIGINTPWRNFRVPVTEIERLTGLDFNSEVPLATQSVIESRIDTQ